MKSLWTAMRALVYTALFVWLWGWVALGVRPYDERLGGPLGPWAIPLGWALIAVGAVLAVSCQWVFILRGRGTPAPFDAPRQVVVGNDVARQIAAGAYNAGMDHAAFTLCWPAAARRWEMRCSTPSRTSSNARSIAFLKAKVSAEPWLFTTMPFRPSRLAPL